MKHCLLDTGPVVALLAENLETDRILTLHERGFRTYRHGSNRAFSLVLQET